MRRRHRRVSMKTSWVGLAPLRTLALQESQRHALLQLDDPHERLDWHAALDRLGRQPLPHATPCATMLDAALRPASAREILAQARMREAVVGQRTPQRGNAHRDPVCRRCVVPIHNGGPVRTVAVHHRSSAIASRGPMSRNAAAIRAAFERGGSTGCCEGARVVVEQRQHRHPSRLCVHAPALRRELALHYATRCRRIATSRSQRGVASRALAMCFVALRRKRASTRWTHGRGQRALRCGGA